MKNWKQIILYKIIIQVQNLKILNHFFRYENLKSQQKTKEILKSNALFTIILLQRQSFLAFTAANLPIILSKAEINAMHHIF